MLHTFLKRFFPVNYTLLHTRKHFVIVLLCKAFPVLEEKIGKCADFKRYFDFYVVFEISRGERIRHRSLVCATDLSVRAYVMNESSTFCSSR